MDKSCFRVPQTRVISWLDKVGSHHVTTRQTRLDASSGGALTIRIIVQEQQPFQELVRGEDQLGCFLFKHSFSPFNYRPRLDRISVALPFFDPNNHRILCDARFKTPPHWTKHGSSSTNKTVTMYADYFDSPWMASNLTVFRTNSSAPSGLRMRAKPLRTYGKRSTTRENSPREPSPKKRRISTEETSLKKQNLKNDESESPSLPRIVSTGGKDSAEPTASDSKSTKDVVKKGSILNFFKPVSSSSSTIAPSPKSDEPQPESTPPSSPPQPPRIEPRRKPRILRFGGSSLPIINNEETESDVQDDKDAREDREDGKGSVRSPLKEQHTTNTTTTKPKKPKPQTVQTTLNISSQAPFSECKVCNTVWNPLYPDDVKYHTKQHAAVLRARKKKKESESIIE
ncbi:hypothetical protein CEP54_003992 [Fusarium duplospermum]|uniref:N-acetyltransferase ESCO zinc-finger domain-containing protein n=1 Tax=Fusarium duplospermum TaxID=1325734 RepID=A0A428QKU3_9HYPO|nr:hypothetical protein CEP54_003992 [Fusarium duplospermum]